MSNVIICLDEYREKKAVQDHKHNGFELKGIPINKKDTKDLLEIEDLKSIIKINQLMFGETINDTIQAMKDTIIDFEQDYVDILEIVINDLGE